MYKTLAAYTFAALYIFLPSVPVTHALGLLAHLPRSAKLKHLFLYPLHGGREHVIFQLVSWVSPAPQLAWQKQVVFHRVLAFRQLPDSCTNLQLLLCTAIITY